MPLIALGALSLAVTLPALSSTAVHAAPKTTYAAVKVASGDTLWRVAERFTSDGNDVQETVDQIMAVNHLSNASLHPGQQLRVPR